jgi:hypothetical protein
MAETSSLTGCEKGGTEAWIGTEARSEAGGSIDGREGAS